MQIIDKNTSNINDNNVSKKYKNNSSKINYNTSNRSCCTRSSNNNNHYSSNNYNNSSSSSRHFLKTLNSPSSILKSKLKTKLLNGAIAASAAKRAAVGSNCIPISGSSYFSSYLSNQNSKALQFFTDNNNLINTNHKLAANHQANRYRQSASPARQRLTGGGGSLLSSSGKLGSTGSQLSVFGRNSKRNMLPPYRTHQTAVNKPLPMGGSMQNVSPLAYKPPRRSSAAGICNENKEKTSPNYRSHSVDELLDNSESTDKKIAEAAALVSAGSLALTNASSTSTLQPNEDYISSVGSVNELAANPVPRREKSANLPPINPQHRKSRSLDHFLDEQTLAAIAVPPSPTEGTQSMQNLATPITPEPIRSSIAKVLNGLPQRAASVRDSKSTTPDRITALRQSPSNRQSPEGISSTEDEREDSQSVKSVKASAPPKSQTRAAAHVHRGNSSASNHRVSGSSSSGDQSNRVSKTTSSSSLGSNSGSNSPNNKTIFNRTMKKVRSLIKK